MGVTPNDVDLNSIYSLSYSEILSSYTLYVLNDYTTYNKKLITLKYIRYSLHITSYLKFLILLYITHSIKN